MASYRIGSADAQASMAQRIYSALQTVGVPAVLLPIVTAQSGFESNGFTSRQARELNNYSGIKYTKNSTFQDGKDGVWARYKDVLSWARDMYRVLSLDLRHQGKPLLAKGLDDYMKRLQANSYFGTDSPATYRNGIIVWLRKLGYPVTQAPGSPAAAPAGSPVPQPLQDFVDKGKIPEQEPLVVNNKESVARYIYRRAAVASPYMIPLVGPIMAVADTLRGKVPPTVLGEATTLAKHWSASADAGKPGGLDVPKDGPLGPIGWIKEHPWLTLGIGVGVIFLVARISR